MVSSGFERAAAEWQAQTKPRSYDGPFKIFFEAFWKRIVQTDNPHNRRKYHYMADILFGWFGFNQTSKADDNSTEAKQLNFNKINRRPAIQ